MLVLNDDMAVLLAYVEKITSDVQKLYQHELWKMKVPKPGRGKRLVLEPKQLSKDACKSAFRDLGKKVQELCWPEVAVPVVRVQVRGVADFHLKAKKAFEGMT